MHWTDEEPVTLKRLSLNLPNSFAPQRSFLEIGLSLMPLIILDLYRVVHSMSRIIFLYTNPLFSVSEISLDKTS
jgi:hypothetical protein